MVNKQVGKQTADQIIIKKKNLNLSDLLSFLPCPSFPPLRDDLSSFDVI